MHPTPISQDKWEVTRSSSNNWITSCTTAVSLSNRTIGCSGKSVWLATGQSCQYSWSNYNDPSAGAPTRARVRARNVQGTSQRSQSVSLSPGYFRLTERVTTMSVREAATCCSPTSRRPRHISCKHGKEQGNTIFSDRVKIEQQNTHIEPISFRIKATV